MAMLVYRRLSTSGVSLVHPLIVTCSVSRGPVIIIKKTGVDSLKKAGRALFFWGVTKKTTGMRKT